MNLLAHDLLQLVGVSVVEKESEMSQAIDELLPCPHCGERAQTIKRDRPDGWGGTRWQWTVECTSCDAGGRVESEEEAAAAWNRRVSSAPPQS